MTREYGRFANRLPVPANDRYTASFVSRSTAAVLAITIVSANSSG
jgi:hypothetical protein